MHNPSKSTYHCLVYTTNNPQIISVPVTTSSSDILPRLTPNVVVEWLTLLLRIREVQGSNLGYPDWGFSWFSSVPPGKFWDSTLKLGNDRFLPHPFQYITHSSHLHSMLYDLSHWKETLNKLQIGRLVVVMGRDFVSALRLVACCTVPGGKIIWPSERATSARANS
jgi:hypothetical protein